MRTSHTILASTEIPGYFREPVAPKIPEITVFFWLIKVLTTGMGKSTSDYLAGLNRVLAGAAVTVGFAIAMWLQCRTRRYVATVYWFAAAVAGTVAADILHIGFGISYLDSTIFYALVVAVIFWLWYRSQGTLSIDGIVTRTREIYYWLTVLATFALGTAAGDLTAASMHLGYRTSAVLFAALIAVPAGGW